MQKDPEEHNVLSKMVAKFFGHSKLLDGLVRRFV